MSYWGTITVGGAPLDLSHLEPFEFELLPLGHVEIATIRVRFHDHCFTETFDPTRHQAPLMTSQASAHEQRAFSSVRYELSRHLPRLILALNGQRVASTREGNMVKVTLQDGTVYPVFFTLRKEAGRRLSMFVVSAYPWDAPYPVPTTGEMKFNLAVAKILQGQKPKFPHR